MENPNQNPWREALTRSNGQSYIILERIDFQGRSYTDVNCNGVPISAIKEAHEIFKANKFQAQYFAVQPDGTISKTMPQHNPGNAAALPKTN